MTPSYLLKYYKENNPITKRILLTRKIMLRFLMFIICSILYIIIKSTGKINLIDPIISDVFVYINNIMYLSYFISIIGLVFFFLLLVLPETFTKIFDNWPYKDKNLIFNFLDWILILPICAVIAVFAFSYLFVIKPISGNSMNPNFDSGERVLITYDKFNIKRGSVIVCTVGNEYNFSIPTTEEQYIKRVIGLPGDSITWDNWTLTISNDQWDNKIIHENYLDSVNKTGNSGSHFYGEFEYKENGEIKRTNVIPEGYVFVMGDNRAGSKDSRIIGLIPIDNILGIVRVRFNGIIPKAIVKRGILE